VKQTQVKEQATHKTITTLSKYAEDIAPYRGREAEFHKLFKPYEVIQREGNCLLNSGIDQMWDLITGVDTTYIYDYAKAFIGVGDSTTAATATQTDLQAASNSKYNAMETGYPTSTTQKATFKASFATDEANFAWNEWVVKTTGAECLNRKVESLGTKTTGTWTLEVAITLS